MTPTAPSLLAADDSGTVGDGITDVSQPRLIGSASAAGLTLQIINASNTVIGSAVAGTGGAYTVTPSAPFVPGTYVLRAQAVDAAGNASAPSGSFTLTIQSSSVATPSIPALLAANDSGTVGDGITNDNTPSLVGTATAGQTLKILNAAGTVLGSITVTVNGTYTIPISTALADGTYSLTAVAVNASGATSAPSGVLTLVIDTTPPAAPTAPSLLPADDSGTVGDGITNVNPPRLIGTAASSGLTIQLLNTSNNVIGSAVAGTGGAYTVTPSSALADGTYVVHVQAVDVAGNVSAASGNFTLVIDTTPPAAPTAPGLLPADDSGTVGDGITNVNLPRLICTAASSGLTIQLLNASNNEIGSAVAGTGGAYTVTPSSALADGTYVVHVQAVDAAGNVSAASGSFTLVILTAAPSAPSAPALAPGDDTGTAGDGITTVAQPHLIGTSVAGDTVQLLNATNNVVGSGVVAGNGSYTILLNSALSPGTYAIRAVAIDLAGNIVPR